MSAFMGEHEVRCFEFPVADGRERRLRVYSVEKLNSCALGFLPMNQFAAENQL